MPFKGEVLFRLGPRYCGQSSARAAVTAIAQARVLTRVLVFISESVLMVLA